jgi:hypothetical protein
VTESCGEHCLSHDYIERMERALAGPRWTLPQGLTHEQVQQYIDDCANGKIPPDDERMQGVLA